MANNYDRDYEKDYEDPYREYNTYELQETVHTESDMDELIAIEFGKSKYHNKNLSNYKQNKFKFNVAGLIFGGPWLLCKGMFLYGMIVLIAVSLVPDIFGKSFSKLLCVTLFLQGNRIYYLTAKKRAQKLMDTIDDQTLRCRELEKNKKIRMTLGIITTIIVSVIIIISFFNLISDLMVDPLDAYGDDLRALNVYEYEHVISENYNSIIFSDESELTLDEAKKIMSEIIIRNAEVELEIIKSYKNDNGDIQALHMLFIEEAEMKLKGYYKIQEGLENEDIDLVSEGVELVDEAGIILGKYNAKLENWHDE